MCPKITLDKRNGEVPPEASKHRLHTNRSEGHDAVVGPNPNLDSFQNLGHTDQRAQP